MGVLKMMKDRIQGKTPGAFMRRSPKWAKMRKSYLAVHNKCVVCGSSEKLEVHHKKPFHLFPEHELDIHNLMTLCESKARGINCHLFAGHLGCYATYNTWLDQTVGFVVATFIRSPKRLEDLAADSRDSSV